MKGTIVSNTSPTTRPFPKLMIDDDGLVVLFHTENKGIVVVCDALFEVGVYVDDWAMDDFRDFSGTVSLSND